MSRREIWEKLYERFDPELPAGHQWRADRPHSPAERIIRALDRGFGTPHILLMGTVGTGKSTELLRIAEKREGRELVVFLDLAHHFSEIVRDSPALDRITSWEVAFLAGLALIGTAEEKLSYAFPKQYMDELGKAWSALATATGTPKVELDISALAKALVGVVGAAVTGAAAGGPPGAIVGGLASFAGALRWALPLGRSTQRLPDQDSNVQTLLNCVNVLIGEFQQVSRRVLILFDGLDRIRDIERAKELFVNSQLLSQLACPFIVSAPFALRHDPATAGVRGFDRQALVNEPVVAKHHPDQHGPGVAFFCELFDRRTGDLATDLISRPLLEELAYRSGGRARDFVTLNRELALASYDADVDTATEEIVRGVIDDQRRKREMGLHRGHIQLLEEVASDPEHRLPESPLNQELLNYQHLLPYPNESEWYYPHPLLTMHLVKPKPPGSGG